MISILRRPDAVYGATEASDFRWEENRTCDVKYDYAVQNKSAKVTVYPSGSPVKYLKLRFRGDLRKVEKVYGDTWERSSAGAYLEWRSVMSCRPLPWFCYLIQEGRTYCYGVKTGADCFASFYVDTDGITLFLNLCCGNDGTDLQAPIVACEVVELAAEPHENAYQTAARFATCLCDRPVLPKTPVFGVNNWYWAYGDISHEIVLEETEQLMELTKGCTHAPYMIIDDGWQINRADAQNTTCIGGPWAGNERFADMRRTAEEIRKRGAKAGLWFRPLLTREDVPEGAKLCEDYGGNVLDLTHPYVLETAEREAKKFADWGFSLIKHDFSTFDTTGNAPLSGDAGHTYRLCVDGRRFYDRTKTTATALKDLYKAVQRGAGTNDVIGCNTVSHLTAGIHSMYRIGGDTSGRSFEWTRRYGINSVMRLPLNDALYRADPDCAPFTPCVPFAANLDFLRMCALTGMTTLASIAPHSLTKEQAQKIREVFLLADRGCEKYTIADYDKNSQPEMFVSQDGKTTVRFDWNEVYDGSRVALTWVN